jgi:hypothetical protein
LINLKQKGSITEHIENFQRLNIKVTDIPDDHFIDVFIGTLKDNIQHEVRLWEPKSLENAFKVERNVESKNIAMAMLTGKFDMSSTGRIDLVQGCLNNPSHLV